MKNKALLLALICAGSLLAADNSDVVYLKNGARLQGVIIENVPNRRIKIQAANGRTSVHKFSDIERITTVSAETVYPESNTAVDYKDNTATVTVTDPRQREKIQKFKEHGGWLVGVDAGLNGIFMTSSGKSSYGGGGALTIPFYYLSPADTKTGKFSTFGFAGSIGSSVGVLKLAAVKNLHMQIDSFVKIGGFFGFDSIALSLGIFYKPTYSVLLNLGNIAYNRVNTFNPAGFELELLFASVNNNLARFIKSPMFKFSIFVLPTKDAFYATLNIAVVNYW